MRKRSWSTSQRCTHSEAALHAAERERQQGQVHRCGGCCQRVCRAVCRRLRLRASSPLLRHGCGLCVCVCVRVVVWLYVVRGCGRCSFCFLSVCSDPSRLEEDGSRSLSSPCLASFFDLNEQQQPHTMSGLLAGIKLTPAPVDRIPKPRIATRAQLLPGNMSATTTHIDRSALQRLPPTAIDDDAIPSTHRWTLLKSCTTSRAESGG